MSAHGFKSLFMAASVAGAALGCYLVSLNVASERAKLERVEGEIVLAQRHIRLLQTEIGTRGRLAQLERWNVGFIRLSAPTADQFLEGGFQLATMTKPDPTPAIEVPIVLASAPSEQGVARAAGTSDLDDAKPGSASRPPAQSAKDMMHIASYERPPVPARPTAIAPPKTARPIAAKPNMTRESATKGMKVASTDDLSPLPAATTGAPVSSKTKETGTSR